MHDIRILSYLGDEWYHWVIVIIGSLLVSLLIMVLRGGKTIMDDFQDTGKAIKNTQFYKDREEKKEIERLTRQVIKKQLEDELRDK